MKRPTTRSGSICSLAVVFALPAFAFLTSTSAALAVPPTIDQQWVSGVSSSNATINAEINPNGLLTKYMLQIDTTGNFKFDQNDSCTLHPPGIVCAQVIVPGDPLAPGLVQPTEYSLPASNESQHVSVTMAGIGATLQPETTYHYRAIAANGVPLVEGADQTFTTPPLGSPPNPTIDRLWISDITSDDATLHAEIDRNGQAAEYHFVLSGPGLGTTSLPSASVPSSEVSIVDQVLSDAAITLDPETEYSVRVALETTSGELQSNAVPFETLGEPSADDAQSQPQQDTNPQQGPGGEGLLPTPRPATIVLSLPTPQKSGAPQKAKKRRCKRKARHRGKGRRGSNRKRHRRLKGKRRAQHKAVARVARRTKASRGKGACRPRR